MVFLSLLLPVTAYTQTSLYELPQGRKAVGLGFTGIDFSSSQDAIGIGGSLGYGVSSRTKIALGTNIGIIDKERYGGSGIDIPPPVMVGIGSWHVSPLGQTGLDYFFSGGTYTSSIFGQETQSFRFGRNARSCIVWKKYLKFYRKCGIMRVSRWQT